MSEFKSFSEYLDQNKKLVKTPKKEEVPDYHGKQDKKPPQSTLGKHQGWSAVPKNAANPGHGYFPGNAPVKPKGPSPQPNENGFAGKSSGPGLEYNPKVFSADKAGEGGKKVKTWPSTKSENFIRKTKNMNMAEFTKYLKRQQYIKGLNEGTSPLEVVQSAAKLAKANDNIMQSLVREIKRQGCIGRLVREMIQHPETFKSLVRLMEYDDGERLARRLVRTMNEVYLKEVGVSAPAFNDNDEEEDEENPDDMGDMGDGDEEDPDNIEGEDTPPGEDEEPGGSGNGEMMGGPHQFSADSANPDKAGDVAADNETDPNADMHGGVDGKNDDMGDEEEMDDDKDIDGGEEDEIGDEMGHDDDKEDDNLGLPPVPMHKKKKKKFPHHHMIDAMAGNPPMASAMQDKVGGGGPMM